MNHVATLLFGPLAGPECSRASCRGWLIWVRMLPGFAGGAVVFVALWVWQMLQQIDDKFVYMPYNELRIALAIILGMMVAVALILAPAVLAGTLAGEKERGSIGLLLTTRVNSFEIVMGRLAGRLSQLAMIELAALPALILIASLAGFDWLSQLAMLALPVAVALGNSGIALAASSTSRRGRDALLLVYLIDVLFLLAPLLKSVGWDWLGVLSPFQGLMPLTWGGSTEIAWITSAAWALMGVVGLTVASWRLRPSCLAEGDDSKQRKRSRRRGWVPPLDDRPMLWKELYIERVGTLGRAGRWIGGLLVLWMIAGSIGLGAYSAWGHFAQGSDEYAEWAANQASIWYGNSAMYIGFLIQWAIGLRAAVTISSERERGTWDALLTSPLEGTEIVRGKLWGSLYALRWLIGSALLAWTITLAMGGMFWPEYAEQMIGLVTIGTFMAAVGVRTSLMSPTATRAMGVTIGLWLGGYMAALALAWIICISVALLCLIGWIYLIQLGLVSFSSRPWFPMTFRLGTDILFFGQIMLWTIAIVVETRLRFDRVAGRMTGGKTAVAIDHLIHGIPMAPVYLNGKAMVKRAELDEVIK